MIAGLEADLSSETERADQNESAVAALKQKVGELEAAATTSAQDVGSELASLQQQLGEMEEANTKLEAQAAGSSKEKDVKR